MILSCTFKGVKIATKEEYEDYSARVWAAIKRRAKLQALQDKKAGLDGQYRLVLTKKNQLSEAFKEVGA